MKLYERLLCCIIAFSNVTFAMTREIAITIDDLPFVGTNSNNPGNLARTHDRFMKILQALVDENVPATGFVIANSIGKNQWELLQAFRDAGFSIGNHTYSHENLNHMAPEQYIANIAKADQILTPIMTTPKYFRYPYLAEGKGETKQAVQDYLVSAQYIVAPVTIDSKDYLFNERLFKIPWRLRAAHLDKIKQEYLDYIWKQTTRAEKRDPENNTKQILLIHANLLNSYCLQDVIQLYKQHGYKFITLTASLGGVE